MSHPFMIRFDGLCCHAQHKNKRRVLMPDASGSSHGNHRVYLEFFADDFQSADSGIKIERQYSREGVPYKRAEFRNVRIELLEVATTTFQTTASYEFRVPKLTEVSKDYGDVKKKFLTDPPDATVGGYFDIPGGILSAGVPERDFTEFVDSAGKPTAWEKRKVPEWVQLDLELKDGSPKFVITNLTTKIPLKLTLKSGAAMVTVGNQTRNDILGLPTNPPPEHFHVYYHMLPEKEPKDQPKPRRGLGLGTGCTNTNWP